MQYIEYYGQLKVTKSTISYGVYNVQRTTIYNNSSTRTIECSQTFKFFALFIKK